ncbi:cellulase family glycosylhydrolase [Paenibacillus roseipurpureus]|uniref:Cellulase family glycosylhydrolase n=1 Tax=Paenibacillus roseopurpureus TaxID=2918901 RepID=A0AA96LKI4_9BACL|nr:cellulase family glycosylhydrolase [Paenibacillus sp. MBLB1832]WNR42751.1 cellulase family glycosylhydrolase [Paenibacillus sp. MBLB1832]
MNHLLDLPSTFFVGCNYWASHAGTAMWSDWNPEQVELDLKRLSEAGIEVIRVFPLWPDFQPIENMYSGRGEHFGYRFGEERLPDTEAGKAGMSVVMMERFQAFTEIAKKYDIKLIVGLITGWMSGRLFVPPALRGKAILTDPDAIRWQVRFVRYFVKHMKHNDTIVAWDLGNECNEMGKVASQEEAYVWTSSVANAIKAVDTTRPLISGMHSLHPKGNWTMQDQGELTDILTTHPYPFWTPYMDFDPLTSMRPTIHATMESLLYAQIGEKPCFAEEMGTMGPMVCSEEVAADFARTSMLSQWAHGLPGLLWWCANDQTKLNHAPYDWVACEGELGLMTEEGRIKPALQQMGQLKKIIQEMPFGNLPARSVEAVCILNSTQDHWATAIGAFLLAKQTGFDIDFRFEDQPLPDANFYMLPCVTGVYGVPKQRWEQLLDKVRQGATLYVSSNDGYMLNFAELTGLTVQNRSRRASDAIAILGDENGGIPLTLPSTFKLDFRNDRAEVLAAEADGNPVLTKATYGKGTVYFCALPVELAMSQQPGVSFKPEQYPYWKMYEVISKDARSARVVQVNEPHVGLTEHAMDAQTRIGVLINYSPDEREVMLNIHEGWLASESLYGSHPQQIAGRTTVNIAANDAVIVRFIQG